MVAINNARR
jgi:hypothetical protein